MGDKGSAAADALTGPGQMQLYTRLRAVRLDLAMKGGDGSGKEYFLYGRNYLAIQ